MPLTSSSMYDDDAALSNSLKLRGLTEDEVETLTRNVGKIRDYQQLLRSLRMEYCAIHNGRTTALLLPSGILSSIFRYASLSETEFWQREGAPRDTPFANSSESKVIRSLPLEVVLSHVCKRWRAVALSTEPIWSAFFCTVNTKAEGHFNRLKSYLQRSGSHPLSLSFDISSSDDSDDGPILPFVRTILPCANRWRSLQIVLSGPGGTIALSEMSSLLIDVAAPQLEALSIMQNGVDHAQVSEFNDEVVDMPAILRGGAAKLSILRMHECNISPLPPPLLNITSLELHNVSSKVLTDTFILDIFRLPFLSTLSLYAITLPSQGMSAKWSTLTANHLTHLRVSFCSTAVCYALSCLSAPVLQSLTTLDVVHHWDRLPAAAFQPHSFPSLTTFICDFSRRSISSSVVRHLAHKTVNITCLIVSAEVDTFSTSIIPALRDGAQDEKIWPHLKRLVLNLPKLTQMQEAIDFLNLLPLGLVVELDERLLSRWKYGVQELKRFKLLKKGRTIGGWDVSQYSNEQIAWPGASKDQNIGGFTRTGGFRGTRPFPIFRSYY